MNIDNFHGALKARDILELSPIVKEAFNNYQDAKFERLSIFFYNKRAEKCISVEGYAFNEPEDTEVFNFGKSTFQLFCGKIADSLLFIDFGNTMCIYVEEKDIDAYMSLFLNERRPLVTDNDFIPFKNDILKVKDFMDFDEVKFIKI